MFYRLLTATAGAPPTSPFLHPLDFLLRGGGQVTVWFPSSCSVGGQPFCSRTGGTEPSGRHRMSPLVPRPSDLPLVDWLVSPLHRGNSGWIWGPFQRQLLRANTISLGFGESSFPPLSKITSFLLSLPITRGRH